MINIKAKQQDSPLLKKRVFVMQPQAIYSRKADEDTLDEISHICGQQPGVVEAVLKGVRGAIKKFVCDGHSIYLPGLGSIRYSVQSKAVEKIEDVKTSPISHRRLIFVPASEIKEILEKVPVSITCYDIYGNELKRVTSTSGDVVDDGDDDNGGNGGTDTSGSQSNGSQSNNQNQGSQQTGGSGNQQQTVEDVTFTFYYHDGTEDSRTGKPGEAVNAPAADEGYHWPSYLPTVFGSVNQTFSEIEDSAQLTASEGVTVKWTWHADNKVNGSALAKEMIVPVGTTIDASEWPEAHPGYHWNSTPEQLNDNVPYKRAGEWYYIREQPDE